MINHNMTDTDLISSNPYAIQEWKAPTMKRIDMKRTLFGSGSSSDGGQPSESFGGIPG